MKNKKRLLVCTIVLNLLGFYPTVQVRAAAPGPASAAEIASEREAINNRFNERMDAISPRYRAGLTSYLHKKGPYPIQLVREMRLLEGDRMKEMEAMTNRLTQKFASAPPERSTGASAAAGSSAVSAPSAGEEVVIDGSGVPKELTFPGKKKRVPASPSPR